MYRLSSSFTMTRKNMLTVFLFGLYVCGFAQADSPGDNWGYSEQEGLDPAKWSNKYAACGRSQQSPINIDSLKVIVDDQLERINFIDYDEFPPDQIWQVENNGHTVKISANYPCPPQLQGGGLRAKYQFLQIHFHWAQEDFRGSEHHLDGRKYPLEMHIVHQRRNKSPKELSEDPIGLAVVAVFFDLGNDANPHLTPIVNALRKVEAPGTVVNETLPNFSLMSVIPHEVPDYFRYNGSLTTPPCSATVQWTVMREPIRVNSQQLWAFRSLQASNSSIPPVYIKDNFRPIQDLAGRTILRYHHSGAARRNGGSLLLLLLISASSIVSRG